MESMLLVTNTERLIQFIEQVGMVLRAVDIYKDGLHCPG